MPPGPKMGPRPPDFDEEMIKQSPTYIKWQSLADGEKMRYACREFIKGQPEEEERLMRRIMIARRNNLRDHETVKEARRRIVIPTNVDTTTNNVGIVTTNSLETLLISANTEAASAAAVVAAASGSANNNTEIIPDTETDITINPEVDVIIHTGAYRKSSKRKSPATLTDAQIEQEMDKKAVESTRSYKAWLALPDGAEFIYNQKYVKGTPDHDWSLRKNIWRRMRYRRENKKMVLHYKKIATVPAKTRPTISTTPTTTPIVIPEKVPPLLPSVSGTTGIDTATRPEATKNHNGDDEDEESELLSANRAAVEAAVAAAQNFPGVDNAVAVAASLAAANPLLESSAAQAALDAAAQLAAAQQVKVEDDDDEEDEEEGNQDEGGNEETMKQEV